MRTIKLIETEDGSRSLYVPELNETYHSFHGAYQESLHVFIKNGLNYWTNSNSGKAITILEIGFGTGLNVLLTAREKITVEADIFLTTLEPYPLPEDIIAQLNYGQLMNDPVFKSIFQQIHWAEWERPVKIMEGFTLLKLKQKLEDFTTKSQKFDVVYFDAFAPNKQSELWTLEILQKICHMMNRGGIFVTYCAKGQLKRDLKAIGFTVETLAGPPGKKEMVRGVKID